MLKHSQSIATFVLLCIAMFSLYKWYEEAHRRELLQAVQEHACNNSPAAAVAISRAYREAELRMLRELAP